MNINNLKNLIVENKEILFILVVYVLVFSFNIDKFPQVMGDENLFMNPAYNLALYGSMGSDIFYGFHNIANYTYWQPPVYILFLAASFKLFGFGIAQARMVGVFLGIFIVFFTYLLAFKMYNKKIGLIASILLVTNPLFLVMVRQARMEIAVAIFTLIALYCTFMALRDSKIIYYFASAFFAIIALLSHPNGLIALLAVLIIISIKKIDFRGLKVYLNKREVLMFILGIIVPVIPYLLYVFLDFVAFQGQFMANIGGSPSDPFKNIITEPIRYYDVYLNYINLLGRYFTFITFAAALILILNGLYYILSRRRFNEKFLFIILAVYMVVFTFMVSSKFCFYVGLLIPYVSILMALSFKDKIRLSLDKKGILSVIFVISLLILVMGNSAAIFNGFSHNKDYDYMVIKYSVQKYVPEGSVVMANPIYWVALKDDYKFYTRYYDKISDIKEMKVEYIIYYERWGVIDPNIYKFFDENCTLIAELPPEDTLGFGIVKIYRVNYNL